MNIECCECGSLFNYEKAVEWETCPACRLRSRFRAAINAVQDLQREVWQQDCGPTTHLLVEKSLKRLTEAQGIITNARH